MEPSANSLNSGDVFIVVTPKEVHLWNGRDASIMKKAKVNQIARFFSTLIGREYSVSESTYFTLLTYFPSLIFRLLT